MTGTFISKDWIIDLIKKAATKNDFFDVSRMGLNIKTSTLYSSVNEQFTPGDLSLHLKATIPVESAGGTVTTKITRSNITFDGSGYPQGEWYVNNTKVVSDFDMVANNTYTHTFNVSRDDKISFVWNETRAAAAVTSYSITITYTGDYYTYN